MKFFIRLICALACLNSLALAFSGPGAGTPESPYQISTPQHLNSISSAPYNGDLSSYYLLMNDIDMSELSAFSAAVIASDTAYLFEGYFNGNGHVIRNLTINATAPQYIGLFAQIGSSATITDLGLENISITCYSSTTDVGGLCGKNQGTVQRCYTTGNINGLIVNSGGMCATASGNFYDCYSQVNISSDSSIIGGFCGSYNGGSLNRCFSTGALSGSQIGGFCATNIGSTPSFSDCFWDVDTSLISSSEFGTGLSTTLMKTQNSFTNFDFNSLNPVWYMPTGAAPYYPKLSTFVSAQYITVPDVIGMTEQNAASTLSDSNLEVGVTSRDHSDTIPAGQVISQDPPSDVEVPEYSQVDLLISLGVDTRDIIYVDADARLNGNGQSWATAYTYLHDALYNASPNDQIWVAQGTYFPDEAEGVDVIDDDRYSAFHLIDGVKIYGGFIGSETDLSQRNWINNETILSGDIDKDQSLTGNSYHVITGNNINNTAILDGFTITEGNAGYTASPDETAYGGGLYNNASSPTVANCTFTNNDAYNGGGGMANIDSSNPIITNCAFDNNLADYGAGMHNDSSNPVLTNCSFSNNYTENGGSGMYNDSSSPTITSCHFNNNSVALECGGGICNENNSSPTITDCTFLSNDADYGGGISNFNSSPVIINCDFTTNKATYSEDYVGDGGGIYCYTDCAMQLLNCTFKGNTAEYSGGGIYIGSNNLKVKIMNCTFIGNVSLSEDKGGGGIFCDSNGIEPTIVNSTFCENTASKLGGGICSINCTDNPTIKNCILWLNHDINGIGETSQIYSDEPTGPTVTYSLVQGTWSGVGNDNIDTDPLFIRQPNPGPDDVYGTPDDDYGNLYLQDYSPCTDAGSNSAVLIDLYDLDDDGNITEPCPYDLNNYLRFKDNAVVPDTGQGTAPIVDMGAFEMQIAAESILYVKASATGLNNGSSWINAFTNLQSAIAVAKSNSIIQEIRVAYGIYTPDSGSKNRTHSFELVNGVTIRGGYSGLRQLINGIDDIQVQVQGPLTILSGDLEGDDDSSFITDNSYHVVTSWNNDATAVLEGFVISGGNADGSSPLGKIGSGIGVIAGNPTIVNCTLTDNHAHCAPAFYGFYGHVLLNSINFNNNDSDADAHLAFSCSDVTVENNMNIQTGQLDMFAGSLTGNGSIVLSESTGINIRKSISCAGQKITNIYKGIFGKSYQFYDNEWLLYNEELHDVIIVGGDNIWAIAPSSISAKKATVYWHGNTLNKDLSAGGVAEATFNGGGTLEIHGRLYDGVDSGASLLYDGLLLSAQVQAFHVKETTNNVLETIGNVTIIPLNGFLLTNDNAMQLYGKQYLKVLFGNSMQSSTDIKDFQQLITLESSSSLAITPVLQPKAITQIGCDIYGNGIVQNELATILTVKDDATVDLSGTGDDGKMNINGKFLAYNNAIITNTNIFVSDAPNILGTLQYDNIGGELYVAGNATLSNNTIIAEGDRYLNVLPDDINNVTLVNNNISVIINQGQHSNQGMLLEVRGRDYVCINGGTAQTPGCISGAWPITNSEIADISGTPDNNNWLLSQLEIVENAKVNLTDRVKYHPGEAEVMYVEQLILYPGAILNTAMRTLYFKELILDDGSGTRTVWDNSVALPEVFDNGSMITNIPLLGFSLVVITFDDPTPSPNNEFDLRVVTRLTDPIDENPSIPGAPLPKGEITLEENVRGNGNGIMLMETQNASSIAAKATFDQASEDKVLVEFEYQFLDTTAPGTELVVYLSDNPEIGGAANGDRIEIARITPPQAGRPGIGTESQDNYATFRGTFACENLNFTHGTYVELELLGQNAQCMIDNWDPQIICTYACGDFSGDAITTLKDYYYILAEYGVSDPNANAACIDMTGDGYISSPDILAWSNRNTVLNSCNPVNNVILDTFIPDKMVVNTDSSKSMKTPAYEPTLSELPGSELIIAGQMDDPNYSHYLVGFDNNGDPTDEITALAGSTGNPISINSRMITDGDSNAYRVDAINGLVDHETGTPLVSPHLSDSYLSMQLQIGGTLPISDMAFDPSDKTTVYVTPVTVNSDGNIYKAAARLELTGGLSDPNYIVTMVYGVDPNTESSVSSTDYYNRYIREPDYQQLQEIEVDDDGHVYVLSAQALNKNDWVLIYDEATGDRLNAQSVSDDIYGPTAMTISLSDQKLFLASTVRSVSDSDVLASSIVNYSYGAITPDLPNLTGKTDITINHPDPNVPTQAVAVITAMAVDPYDGTVYVAGCRLPHPDALPSYYSEFTPVVTIPTLAIIESGNDTAISKTIDSGAGPHSMLLPLSIILADICIPGEIPGDIVGDQCEVDLEDLAALLGYWLEDTGVPAKYDLAPDPVDGKIDLKDFAQIANSWLSGVK